MRLSGLELQQATGGTWHNGMPEAIHGIGTDTRDFEAGNVFLALRGPNFDGHTFANQVADRAAALIGDVDGMAIWKNFSNPKLQVDDTLQALGNIATAWRNKLAGTTLMAITGSYGKTTVRSMLAHVFSQLGLKVHATHANLNNLIGVPMTLLGTPEACEVALIECGISEKGEMERLSRIVRPDVAIITGITGAHGEGLGGVHGVAIEKAKLLTHLQAEGWYALGYGVQTQLQTAGVSTPAGAIDMDNDNVVSWQLNGSRASFCNDKEEAELTLALPARHWAANMALVATAVLNHFRTTDREIALQQVISALQSWQPVDGRMQMANGMNGCRIVDDSYNANPVSMQAAIDTLALLTGKRIAILGDMGELGSEAEQAHAGINLSGIDQALLVGEQMRHLAACHPDAKWFASTDEALVWIENHKEMFADDATALIKASRFMKLDRIVKALQAEEKADAL